MIGCSGTATACRVVGAAVVVLRALAGALARPVGVVGGVAPPVAGVARRQVVGAAVVVLLARRVALARLVGDGALSAAETDARVVGLAPNCINELITIILTDSFELNYVSGSRWARPLPARQRRPSKSKSLPSFLDLEFNRQVSMIHGPTRNT